LLPVPISPSKPPAAPAIPVLEAVEHALASCGGMPGALLPVLHAVQDRLGHVPAAAVLPIAQALNLSRAEVHGVITYYHHFRSTPPGRHVLQVCRAEACQACGAEALLAHAERVLGCERGQTRADGAVSVQAVYCLGLCAQSPAVQIDDRVHARVSPERLERLLAAAGLPALSEAVA
jgi:formate dehydrogenase subunit gamma